MILLKRRINTIKPFLLLHCNGADASTAFTDSSPEGHTVTATANAQIDTGQSKFGGSSALFDGTDDFLSIADTDFNLTTNFTIEYFLRYSDKTTNTNQSLVWFDDGVTDAWWNFGCSTDGANIFFGLYDATETNIVIVNGNGVNLADATWYHCAMCKVGDEYGLYLDGIQKAHTSDASTHTITGSLYVGSNPNTNRELNGWMDEIRICKSNSLNANPVAGLTDKIQVPQIPYPSWS